MHNRGIGDTRRFGLLKDFNACDALAIHRYLDGDFGYASANADVFVCAGGFKHGILILSKCQTADGRLLYLDIGGQRRQRGFGNGSVASGDLTADDGFGKIAAALINIGENRTEFARAVQIRDDVLIQIQYFAVFVAFCAALCIDDALFKLERIIRPFFADGYQLIRRAEEVGICAVRTVAVVLGHGVFKRVAVQTDLLRQLFQRISLYDDALRHFIGVISAVALVNGAGQTARFIKNGVHFVKEDLLEVFAIIVNMAVTGFLALIGKASCVGADVDHGQAGRYVLIHGLKGHTAGVSQQISNKGAGNSAHMPQVCIDLLNHADAVAGVVKRADGIQLVVLRIALNHFFVVLKAAAKAITTPLRARML